jgi:hypothetical protein
VDGIGAEVISLAVASGNCLAVGHILAALPWELGTESATILTAAIMFGHDQLVRILLDLIRPNDAVQHTGILFVDHYIKKVKLHECHFH